jgi:hypothetical protein
MATNYNPRIVTDGLVLCLDGANGKSVPKNNIIGTWTDFNSQQAYYDVTGPYSITLKTGNSNWVGYYPATIPSGGQYVFTFKYYQTGSIGSLTVDNDGANDNAYNATLYPSLGEEKTFTKVVDVSAPGLIQFFLRRNSGGDIYIYDVSYFKLETTWTDLSGKGNNGTLVNGVGYDGSNGGSLTFDGVNDEGAIPSSPSNILTQLTAEAWFKPTGTPGNGYHVIFQKEGGYSGAGVYGLRANPSGTAWGILSTGSAQNQQFNIYSTTILSTNNWYHLVMTYDLSYNLKLYVNGILENTGSDINAVPFQNSSSISIGLGDSRRVNGSIPLIRVYNKALTASEIQQNFNATRGRYGV